LGPRCGSGRATLRRVRGGSMISVIVGKGITRVVGQSVTQPESTRNYCPLCT
jgi:hypothetical protein